ncbi:DUF3558 family protein [Allokutzneria sp. NRRL B-24872]|uniref:DUF3558 family protein n=1 Tax=Allokutzneria sp. NRRL B-24872 TaxID=1137961 RepID=UPI00143CE85F
MNTFHKKTSWLTAAAVGASLAISGCSTVVAGQATESLGPAIPPGHIPTAADLCRLMTPADFPTQGQLAPNSPKLEEKYAPSCFYHVQVGGVGVTFSGSLGFTPEVKILPAHLKTRREDTVSGRRVAIGQGEIRSGPEDCGILFESPIGLWSILVSDDSAPNRDGCASVRHVAERVIPRVP